MSADTRTPFEREIDEAASFSVASVLQRDPLEAAFLRIAELDREPPIDILAGFSYSPVDKVCPCCQRKHTDHGPTCASCAPYWV